VGGHGAHFDGDFAFDFVAFVGGRAHAEVAMAALLRWFCVHDLDTAVMLHALCVAPAFVSTNNASTRSVDDVPTGTPSISAGWFTAPTTRGSQRTTTWTRQPSRTSV
jgi:hypothetical protein